MMKKGTVLFTGSFDPVSVGHEDVISRLSHAFDHVRVTVFVSDEKKGFFPVEKRLEFLKRVCEKFGNVTADLDRGMVKDYVKREGIGLIVRGVRDERDLAYEKEMAAYNKAHGGVETLLFIADEALSQVSSSEIRRRLMAGEDATPLLPQEIAKEIQENWQFFCTNPLGKIDK